MLSENSSETVNTFIPNDEAYNFINIINDTPAFWKKFLHEVLAMIRQIGVPTCFMVLDCNDLRWNELIFNCQINWKKILKRILITWTFFIDAVILIWIQFYLINISSTRLKYFFKVIIVDGPLGKITYHAIKVEFHVSGSFHIYSFLWVLNAQILTEDNFDEYRQIID